MKMFVLTSVLGIGLIGCGPKFVASGIIESEELRMFKAEFDYSAQATGYNKNHYSGIGLTIHFSDLPGNTIGRCKTNGRQSIVEIDRTAWASWSWSDSDFNYANKRKLVFHELGHCLLLKGHNDNEILGGRRSIMTTYHSFDQFGIHSVDDFLNNAGIYFKELFLGKTNMLFSQTRTHKKMGVDVTPEDDWVIIEHTKEDLGL